MKTPRFVLTPLQYREICAAVPEMGGTEISLDLGMGAVTGRVEGGGIRSGALRLPLPPPDLLDPDDHRTLLVFGTNGWEKWQYFDAESGRFYKMVFVAEGAPPTVEISGIKMHVTRDGNPMLDTRRKLRALGRFTGPVLDTCCGLGYTAIALAQLPGVRQVVSIEKDPVMRQLCRENPWSQGLLHSPKIEWRSGDTAAFIRDLPAGSFAAILHDPPRFALAPALYETVFYRECHRVLRPGGKMYHYTGNPNRQTRRQGLPERTQQRLAQAGFRKTRLTYQGVWARK